MAAKMTLHTLIFMLFNHIPVDMGQATYNYLCEPTDCSQPATKHRKFFPCEIGKQDDWKTFQVYHNFREFDIQHYNNSKNAPTISKIKLRTFTEPNGKGHNRNPYLNVSMVVPKGRRVIAVLMIFSSVEDEQHRDLYYFDKPTLRLFNFTTYRWSRKEPPLQLQYPCLKGLDDRSSYPMVYRLTLTSVSIGQWTKLESMTYYITAYTKLCRENKFAPTIVTSLIPGTYDVRVVFEPVPAGWFQDSSKISYNLYLYDKDSDELIDSTTVFHISGDYKCTLYNGMARESVYVQLVIKGLEQNYQNRIRIASSFPILTSSQKAYSAQSAQPPQPHESTSQDKKVPFIFMGGLVGAILIITMVILYGSKYSASGTDIVFVKICDDEYSRLTIPDIQKTFAKCFKMKSQIWKIQPKEFIKRLMTDTKITVCSCPLKNRTPCYIIVCASPDDFAHVEMDLSQIRTEHRIAFLSVRNDIIRADYVQHLSALISEVFKLYRSQDIPVEDIKNKIATMKIVPIDDKNRRDSILFNFKIFSQPDLASSTGSNAPLLNNHPEREFVYPCPIHKNQGKYTDDNDSITRQMEQMNFPNKDISW